MLYMASKYGIKIIDHLCRALLAIGKNNDFCKHHGQDNETSLAERRRSRRPALTLRALHCVRPIEKSNRTYRRAGARAHASAWCGIGKAAPAQRPSSRDRHLSSAYKRRAVARVLAVSWRRKRELRHLIDARAKNIMPAMHRMANNRNDARGRRNHFRAKVRHARRASASRASRYAAARAVSSMPPVAGILHIRRRYTVINCASCLAWLKVGRLAWRREGIIAERSSLLTWRDKASDMA